MRSIANLQQIPCIGSTEKPGLLNRISHDARTVKQSGFSAVFNKAGIICKYLNLAIFCLEDFLSSRKPKAFNAEAR